MGKIGLVALALSVAVLLDILGHCEMSLYPGLRRKPMHQPLQQSFDVPSDFLAQLMEENARRRLQQQFEQQLELINMQMSRQRQRQEQRERYRQRLQELAENEEAEVEEAEAEAEVEAEAEEQAYAGRKSHSGNKNYNINRHQNNNNNNQFINSNSAYNYKHPGVELNENLLRERIPFAVGPSDPRFYQPDEQDDDEDLDSHALDEYEEYVPAESQSLGAKAAAAPAAASGANNAEAADKEKDTRPILSPAPVETSKLVDSGTTTFHRIKPQSAAAAAAVGGPNVVAAVMPAQQADSGEDAATGNANTRHDINALINKLQKEGKSAAIINSGHDAALGRDEALVVRQHLGMEGEMGMYIVALIAGVSAAVTVGLIALGIAWYTMHNRSKAAADVEYPAYGVTGPNKDISPSGDRKLAQSAQMYHYQHQKQQIIAMENRQAVEGSCGMSDVESDDDENEEGDYTVYECPGLAPPTGEMEVKNPLFVDETPMTPSSNSATASASTASTTTANNITQATPQQPPAAKKGTFKVVVGAAPDPKATSPSSEEKKQKKNKK